VSDKWYVHAAERRSAADDPAALHVRNFPDEDAAKRFTAQLLARKKKVISAGTVQGIRPAKQIDRRAIEEWCRSYLSLLGSA
jgi:hypothetical protein